MADVNINGKGSQKKANDFEIPKPKVKSSTVSFKSYDEGTTVCFTNVDTFGISNFTIGASSEASLTLEAEEDTEFCLEQPCTKGGPPYNITMGGGVPGPKHGGEHKK